MTEADFVYLIQISDYQQIAWRWPQHFRELWQADFSLWWKENEKGIVELYLNNLYA